LSATPDGNDGERLKVTYCGFFTLVGTVELETWFPLADLEPETLTPWRQLAHGLAPFRPAVAAPRERMLATGEDRYLRWLRGARNGPTCRAVSAQPVDLWRAILNTGVINAGPGTVNITASAIGEQASVTTPSPPAQGEEP
jgi:hypothetical protein